MLWNKKKKQDGNWALILNPVQSEIEKADLTQKLIEIVSFSMDEAAQLVDLTPLVLFDGVDVGKANDLKKYFEKQNIDVIISNDAALKKKCHKTIWPEPPDFGFLALRKEEDVRNAQSSVMVGLSSPQVAAKSKATTFDSIESIQAEVERLNMNNQVFGKDMTAQVPASESLAEPEAEKPFAVEAAGETDEINSIIETLNNTSSEQHTVDEDSVSQIDLGIAAGTFDSEIESLYKAVEGNMFEEFDADHEEVSRDNKEPVIDAVQDNSVAEESSGEGQGPIVISHATIVPEVKPLDDQLTSLYKEMDIVGDNTTDFSVVEEPKEKEKPEETIHRQGVQEIQLSHTQPLSAKKAADETEETPKSKLMPKVNIVIDAEGPQKKDRKRKDNDSVVIKNISAQSNENVAAQMDIAFEQASAEKQDEMGDVSEKDGSSVASETIVVEEAEKEDNGVLERVPDIRVSELQRANDMLAREKTALVIKYEEMCARCKDLEDVVEKNAALLAIREKALAEASGTIEELQEQQVLHQGQQDEKQVLHDRIGELQQSIDSARLASNKRIVSLEESIAEKQRELGLKEKEISRLSAERRAQEEEKKSMAVTIQKLTAMNQGAEQYKDEARRVVAELQRSKEEFTQNLADSEKLLKEKSDLLNEKGRRLEDIILERDRLKIEVGQLSNQVSKFTTEKDRVELVQRRTQLQMKMQEVEMQLKALAQDESIAQKKIEEHTQRLTEWAGQKEALEKSLTEARQSEKYILEMLMKKQKAKTKRFDVEAPE